MSARRLELTAEDIVLLENTFVRIAGYQHESIVDGVGIRTTVFFQGCHFNCTGCHNLATHAMNGGELTTGLEVYKEIYDSKLASGVTFSGGEPFLQETALRNLAKVCKKANRHVTIYTGHEFGEILTTQKCSEDNRKIRKEIVNKYVDTLITGRYIQELRTLEQAYIGSSNQEIHEIKR